MKIHITMKFPAWNSHFVSTELPYIEEIRKNFIHSDQYVDLVYDTETKEMKVEKQE